MISLVGSFLPHFPTLPLLIFVAEVAVVTLSTVRIIFVSRGKCFLAPLLGVFEVSIWLFAIGQIMRNLTDVGCYVAFAAGFTAGNYLGILLERKLALGHLLVTIYSRRPASDLVARLKASQYGVTVLEGVGATGPVQVIITAIQRKQQAAVVALIQQFDPRAFYSVHELQATAAGIFPAMKHDVRPTLPFPPRLFQESA